MTVIQTLKDIITIATTLVEAVDRLKKREDKPKDIEEPRSED